MPNILYLDTSAKTTMVAVTAHGAVVAKEVHPEAREQGARLNGLIDGCLRQAGIAYASVDAIAVCGGPGSYTGLRIGLGVAKGLAFALQTKLLLFDRLSLIAISHRAVIANRECLVILKARQGEVFAALFDAGQSVLLPPRHIFENELAAWVGVADKERCCITDDPATALPGVIQQLPDGFVPDVEAWCPLAEARLRRQEWDDLAYCEPFYLKDAFTTRPKKWKRPIG